MGEQIVAMSLHDAAAKDAIVAAVASGTQWALRALWMRRDETVVPPDDPLEDALLRASQVHDGSGEAGDEDLMLRAADLLGRCEGPRAWARLVELRDHGKSYAVGREAIDRQFWLDTIANAFPAGDDQRVPLARRAARRIHAAFHIAPRQRQALERSLMRRLWPLC